MSIFNLIPRALRQRIVLGRIKALLLKAGVPAEMVEGIMSGWKTWAGGITLILGGALQIAKTVADGHFSFTDIQTGLGMIGAGLAAIGVGHKIEKAAEVVANGK